MGWTLQYPMGQLFSFNSLPKTFRKAAGTLELQSQTRPESKPTITEKIKRDWELDIENEAWKDTKYKMVLPLLMIKSIAQN